MSAGVDAALMATVALFLAIGGDTEESIRGEPPWEDGTPQCQAKIVRGIACERMRGGNNAVLWRLRNSQDPMHQERSWEQILNGRQVCEIDGPPQLATRGKCIPRSRIEEILLSPTWVPADQPTEHLGINGMWMKLRLEVAEGAEVPPRRVRARPAPAATAWGPERLLGALRTSPLLGFAGQVEAHVRTLAAVPANIIQRVREGR